MFLVLSASLNPESRSRILARRAFENLQSNSLERPSDYMDLADYQLPFCDGASAYNHPQLPEISERIAKARGVLIASPVYNFDVNAALKNVVELTGKNAWTETVVGFLLSAGGQGSYMSVMPFANSLMLDFRCLILPRFVYTTEESFVDGQVSEEIESRIQQICDDVIRVGVALGSVE